MTALSDAQLRAAFASKYPGRDWAGDCQAVAVNACDFTGGERVIYGSATAAYRASAIESGYAAHAPRGAFHYFAIPGEPDGHVGVDLSGGGMRMLHGYRLLDEQWGTNLGTVSVGRLLSERPGWTYLGWSRTNGANTIDLAPFAPLAPHQRTTAGWPVGFRALANLADGDIARILPPGTVVDGVWWQYGDGAGSGEDRFILARYDGLQGYIHLGDLIQSGVEGIPEYEGQIVKPTPKPEPPVVVPPVTPPVDPPVVVPPPARPITQEDLMALQSALPSVSVAEGALGSIIEKPATRKRVYSVWVILGLVLTAITAGLIAGVAAAVVAETQGWPPPVKIGVVALAAVSGAYGALSPQMAMLARANTPTGV